MLANDVRRGAVPTWGSGGGGGSGGLRACGCCGNVKAR
jgi:hypothetical protein